MHRESGLCGLFYEWFVVRAIVRSRVTQFDAGNDVRFNSAHKVHFQPPVKNEESTMQNHTTITSTHNKSETPFAVVNLTPNDITPRDWTFLKPWAEKLGVTIDVLLKRIARGNRRSTLRGKDS